MAAFKGVGSELDIGLFRTIGSVPLGRGKFFGGGGIDLGVVNGDANTLSGRGTSDSLDTVIASRDLMRNTNGEVIGGSIGLGPGVGSETFNTETKVISVRKH